MKFLITLLVGNWILFSFEVEGQVDSLACERHRFFANEAIAQDDFKSAATHLLKAETTCVDFDTTYTERLIGCLLHLVNSEEFGSHRRELYMDTLLNVWERQERLGTYQTQHDLLRASYLMNSSASSPKKADSLFQRGIKQEGSRTHESFIVYAYYTTYLLFDQAEGDQKEYYKTRLFLDYFHYTDLSDSSATNFSPQTEETKRHYLDYAFPDCNSLLLEVDKFIHSLPKDTVRATHRISQIEKLLDNKRCTENVIYHDLIDTWLKLDSSSLYARYTKERITNTFDPHKWIDTIMSKTTDPELKAQLQYQKAYMQNKAGQYVAAHTSGKACTGEYQSKGLLIAAQSVAALANSCGDSTFERKCNYLYAAQLAEEAGNDGQATKYRSRAPATSCTMDKIPVQLSCWGVTVYVCP